MGLNFRLLVLAGLPVVAVAMGGATSPLSGGLVLVAMGLAVILFPPQQKMCPVFVRGALVLWAWCAVPLLPAGWFTPELWRATLESAWGHPLSPTYSAQPWMTLEAWLYLGAVLVWMAWLMAQVIDERERGLLLRLYLLGILVVAVAGLAAKLAGCRLPFWDGAQPGPFPNRNQSANVLALASVAGFSLGLRQLYHGRKNGWVWLGVTLILLAFVTVVGSRAGLVLFFAGAGAWLTWDLLEAKKKSRVALGATAAMLLLAFALLTGGEAVDRVLHSAAAGPGWARDTRLVLQRDAVEMGADQPVFGLGLGNFDGVFGLYRDHYRNTNRPIHPESDWVWWWCETGTPGLLLLLGLMGWVIRGIWPGGADKDRRLRRAALVIVVIFALHGLVDVPGHRLGSVLALLFFVPLAMPVRGWALPGVRARYGVAAAGLAVLAFGVIQTCGALGQLDWPGRSRVDWLRARSLEHDAAGRHGEALDTALEAQKLVPLDWRFHFQEGTSRLGLNSGWPLAARAFWMVRLLEPDSPYVQLEIGMMWLGKNKTQVLSAWKQALRRRDFMRPGFFQEMFRMAERDPATQDALVELTKGYPELDLFVLHQIPEASFDAHLAGILRRRPSDYGLNERDITPFFQAWRKRRGDARFVAEIREHPDWLEAGWWTAALAHASLRQWAPALALADRYLKPPALPVLDMDESKARETVRKYPDDLPAGLFLFEQALREGNLPAARKRLDQLLLLPDHPAYLFYLESRLCLKEGREPEAWIAVERYRVATTP